MKNIIKKIGGLCLGLAMLSGVAVGISTNKVFEVDADTTKTLSIKDYVADNDITVSEGSTIGSTVYAIDIDSNISLSATNTVPNDGTFWGTSTIDWRYYRGGANNSAQFTLSAANGCTIKTVKFTYTNNNAGVLASERGQSIATAKRYTSGTTINVNSSAFSCYVANTSTKTNGQVRITSIEVVYAGGETSDVITALSITPAKMDYKAGDVIQSSSYTVSVTKNGTAGSLSDLDSQIGYYDGEIFTKRINTTFGSSVICYEDNALLFTAKYPTEAGGSTYLNQIVSLNVDYAYLTSFNATASITTDVGKTEQIEITVNEFANPGATFVSSNEGVATVDSTGLITATGSGSCTITATSVGKTSGGASLTATITINVNASAVFETEFNSSNKGFSAVDTTTNEIIETKEFQTGYYLTLQGTPSGAGAKIIQATASNGEQFGTTSNPFTELVFKSNNFGSTLVSKVTVALKGASSSSSVTVSVKVGNTNFTSVTSMPIEGNSAMNIEFTGSGYGDVVITMTSISKGLFINGFAVYGTSGTSDDALANGFARKCELEDSCNNAHASIISEYEALPGSVKTLADSIVIHDWEGTSSARGNRTLELTVAQKMEALIADVSSARISSLQLIESNASTWIIIAVSLAGLTAIGGYFFYKKRKENF